MNNKENVIHQYSDDKNLSIRTNLHLKYSTNKKGLIPWLFEHYQFSRDFKILELGCGNGNHWENRINLLPDGCELILSDLSEGMVEIVKSKYSNDKNVSFKKIYIQNISYPDNFFDVVIANHMLYHVSDLPKSLSEVNRVLKKEGKFYSTTIGNGGMRTFLQNAMQQIHCNDFSFIPDFSFHLQNGSEILKKHFKIVHRFDYEDSLLITKTQDLIDWVKSTSSISTFSKKDFDNLFQCFESIQIRDGAIRISKECGLFISEK